MFKNTRFLLVLSLIVNILMVTASGYFIYKKGGITYIEKKINQVLKKDTPSTFSPYYLSRTSLFEKAPSTNGSIVFLGDSITDHNEWGEFFGDSKILNRGISGDTTEGVLNRLYDVIKTSPSKLFIMIGINDILTGKSASSVLSNYKKIVQTTLSGSPKTKIYVQSVLSVNTELLESNYPEKNGDKTNKSVQELNSKLKDLSVELSVSFIDLNSYLTVENQLNQVYTFDGVHLSGEAYDIWGKAIEQYVEH